MTEYLLLSPVLLTDEIFAEYGGDTGTYTSSVRTNAYAVAETMVQQSLHCFLSPTTVTGTFPISVDSIYQLHHPAVTEIKSVRFWSSDGSCNKTYSDGCANIIDAATGVVKLSDSCGSCGTNVAHQFVDIAYTSGVDVAQYPNVRLGLSIVAKKILEQITDPDAALGGAGDPEVRSFSDTGLSISYGNAVPSTFGASPEMQLATRLIRTSLPRRIVFRR